MCEIDAAGAHTPRDVVGLVRERLEEELQDADGRPLAARVVISGVSEAHDALQDDSERWESEIRSAANDLAGERVWVEKVLFRTDPAIDIEALLARDDAVGQVVRSLRSLPTDEVRIEALIAELADLRHKLPNEVRDPEYDGGLRLDDREQLVEMVQDVERLLIPRLLQREGG